MRRLPNSEKMIPERRCFGSYQTDILGKLPGVSHIRSQLRELGNYSYYLNEMTFTTYVPKTLSCPDWLIKKPDSDPIVVAKYDRFIVLFTS